MAFGERRRTQRKSGEAATPVVAATAHGRRIANFLPEPILAHKNS